MSTSDFWKKKLGLTIESFEISRRLCVQKSKIPNPTLTHTDEQNRLNKESIAPFQRIDVRVFTDLLQSLQLVPLDFQRWEICLENHPWFCPYSSYYVKAMFGRSVEDETRYGDRNVIGMQIEILIRIQNTVLWLFSRFEMKRDPDCLPLRIM